MISDARGSHVSPGIYTEEKDVVYSVKSLGVTSLGIVGEALKGPAFQNIPIETWADFIDYFGGTSTEKFKANGRPKYEMPYIAKAYLGESRRLNVVRVLGLSGYDAGPAWVLYNSRNEPILILRSKMTYDNVGEENLCLPKIDKPSSVVESITAVPYSAPIYSSECVITTGNSATQASNYEMGIKVTCKEGSGFKTSYTYNVSLLSTDRNYIYNVLGVSPSEGEAPIYVDSVFEGSFIEGEHVSGNGFTELTSASTVSYTFYQRKLNSDGKTYSYSEIAEEIDDAPCIEESALSSVTADSPMYVCTSASTVSEEYYTSFKDAFRCAQSPWVVSNMVASSNDGESIGTMKKLFKFYTISDGNAANYQVKISIQNIKPEDGTFDVVVRDFYDTDTAPSILEKFSKCTMVEGESNFIGYKIGTYDGGYEAKSKYITVEIADGENLSAYVPCGFIGYPNLFGGKIKLSYNTEYKPSVKAKRQYFGMNSNNIETDILDYKGKFAYTEDDSIPEKLTNGFHLDSLLSHSGYGFTSATTFVDGVSGYTFDGVSDIKVTAEATKIPRIIEGSYMNETIYKDVNLRKFTMYLYGGFDGWDVNRGYRTNTDDFKSVNYSISGSDVFSYVSETGYQDMLKLDSDAITSDYYAYLGGYKQFANPEDIDINVFATPGIDWYNNNLLTEDALDIIEDSDDGRGGDALYIMDSPQYNDNGMQYSVDEITDLLGDLDIESSYACTYFPWIKYFDSTQKKYIDLPATKDVVRNIAMTDNNSYPWFAPAGVERGSVDCISAVKKTTLSEEDELYEARINPIKTFAQDGVKIWGNKTLYSVDSPLNRINVRRLMIRIKKLIKVAAKNLIFEQYDSTLEKQFKTLVEPILSDVKSNRGISDYKLITEVTAEAKDQHILPAKILVKPISSLEYISISFVVYPESVEFDE